MRERLALDKETNSLERMWTKMEAGGLLRLRASTIYLRKLD